MTLLFFCLLLLYPWLLAPFGMPAPVSGAPPDGFAAHRRRPTHSSGGISILSFFFNFWLGLLSPCLLLGAPGARCAAPAKGRKKENRATPTGLRHKSQDRVKKSTKEKTPTRTTPTHRKMLSNFFWRKGKDAIARGPRAGGCSAFRQKKKHRCVSAQAEKAPARYEPCSEAIFSRAQTNTRMERIKKKEKGRPCATGISVYRANLFPLPLVMHLRWIFCRLFFPEWHGTFMPEQGPTAAHETPRSLCRPLCSCPLSPRVPDGPFLARALRFADQFPLFFFLILF